MTGAAPAEYGLKLRPVPILVTAALALAMPYLAAYCALFASRMLHWGSPHGPVLWWLYLHHAFQLLLGLIGIAIVKRFVPADYAASSPPSSATMRTASPNMRYCSPGSGFRDKRVQECIF